ncbi:MAG TPA: tRNA1(Val) (adenine(37)-N6)-methyltransferase [Haloplasmataceae bacterium]
MLKANEALHYLFGNERMKIIQRDDMFHFSLDSILLSHFVTINKKCRKIVDLGTGNAPIPLYLSVRTKAKIIGVEIQAEAYDLAIRNVKLNGLLDQITLYNADLKGIHQIIGANQYDVVTCNPPFFKVEGNQQSANDYLTIARHEVLATLDDVVKEASLLLNHGGYFALVHRPDRLVEILETLKKYRLEPKRLRFVYPKMNREANTILIEARKTQREGGLRILPPLYVYTEDGNYTEEIRRLFILKHEA